MNKSLNLSDDEPKSLASSVEGTMSLSNLPVAVIVSPVASPKSTLPFKIVPPVTVKSPVSMSLPCLAKYKNEVDDHYLCYEIDQSNIIFRELM